MAAQRACKDCGKMNPRARCDECQAARDLAFANGEDPDKNSRAAKGKAGKAEKAPPMRVTSITDGSGVNFPVLWAMLGLAVLLLALAGCRASTQFVSAPTPTPVACAEQVYKMERTTAVDRSGIRSIALCLTEGLYPVRLAAVIPANANQLTVTLIGGLDPLGTVLGAYAADGKQREVEAVVRVLRVCHTCTLYPGTWVLELDTPAGSVWSVEVRKQ